MRRLVLALACAAALAGGAAASAQAAPLVLAEVGRFATPVYVTAPPGDLRRVFVVEKAGTIQVLDGTARSTFADLSASVLSTDNERGLLSMAFAPDYATSGLFYVYYTAVSPAGAITIEERRRDPANPARADPSYRRVLVQIAHPVSNHNGGQLQIGPDGALWAGTGDGGGGGDPQGNGQNRAALLGKLLRIARSGDSTPAVAFYGLRNPWRFSFDRQTGDLVIADVGQDLWEEIDFVPAAALGTVANFGWNRFEGTHVYPSTAPPASAAGTTLPVAEFSHGDGWCSITGGYVVRDAGLPELAGQYVFGDFCKGRVYAMTLPNGTPRDLGLPAVSNVSSFGEDGCGRIYVALLGGTVYRLASTGACVAPAAAPGTPGATPVATGPRDSTPPKTRLTFSTRQHVLRNGWVSLAVRCDELCTLRARGTVLVSKVSAAAVRTTSTVRRSLVAGAKARLRLRLSSSLRARVKRSLARGRRAVIRIEVRATDGAGNARTSTRRVRIVR